MRCRVILYSKGTGRGPDKVVSIIEDAANPGCSDVVNDGAPLFFTLPYDHAANLLITPYETHVEMQRQETVGQPWATLGWGLIEDFDHDANDVIWMGRNYLAFYENTMTGLKATYTAQKCSTIISNEATAAAAEVDSRVGFVTMGTIETTSTTSSVISDYRPHLSLMLDAARAVQAGTTARPIFSVNPGTRVTDAAAPPFTFNFYANKGQRRDGVNLEYGGLVTNFRLVGGYRDLASNVVGVAQKTTGSTVMYTEQSGVTSATYGKVEVAIVYGMLPDQASLDNMAKSDASVKAQPYRSLAVAVRGLDPTEVAVGDSYPVTIKRGKVNLDHAYYTLWAWRWRGYADGSEDLFLSLLPEAAGLAAPLASAADPATPGGTGATGAAGQPVTYKVLSGDNLNTLARRWGTTPQAIMDATNAQVGKINGVRRITNVSVIYTGALLVRPS